MLSLLYKIFVLAVLFAGGFLLMRYGMDVSQRVSLIVSFGVLPAFTFALWLAGYRGKKFK